MTQEPENVQDQEVEVESDPRKDYLRDTIAATERDIAALVATNKATEAERDKYAAKAETQRAEIKNLQMDVAQKKAELGE